MLTQKRVARSCRDNSVFLVLEIILVVVHGTLINSTALIDILHHVFAEADTPVGGDGSGG